MANELKPCPFCGGKDECWLSVEELSSLNHPGIIVINCNKCGALGPDAKSEKKAIDLWNRREG